MTEKEVFLKEVLVPTLSKIDLDTKAVFGKMNVHQMIEHLTHSVKIASGKIIFENKQSDELTAKMYRFMMSEKPFRDNTPNSNLPNTPLAPTHENVADSLHELQVEIDNFFKEYEQPELRIGNPFFGELSKNEQVHLLNKHAMHHLRQFDSMP